MNSFLYATDLPAPSSAPRAVPRQFASCSGGGAEAKEERDKCERCEGELEIGSRVCSAPIGKSGSYRAWEPWGIGGERGA